MNRIDADKKGEMPGLAHEISGEAEAALRKGWYLGEESFKDKLLAMVDRVRGGRNPRNTT